MSKQLPIVAIVGRPNVGKSSLFNRITAEARPSSKHPKTGSCPLMIDLVLREIGTTQM